ncbi:T-cell surface antigen CD2 [Lissotriton helveticus]
MPSPKVTLVLLLLGALSRAGGNLRTVYGPLTGPVRINLSDITDSDTVVWKSSDKQHIAKWKSGLVGKPALGFSLLSNNALQVDQEQDMTLVVEVADDGGKLKKNETIRLIRIETLPKPTIIHTCQGTLLNFTCFVGRGSVKGFTVTTDDMSAKGVESSTMFNSEVDAEAKVTVKCIVKNEVSEESQEVSITCSTEWDILLIASVAGGGVALIIFIVLLIYCVLRCHELHSAKQNSEEELELSSGIPAHENRQRRPPDSRNHPRSQPPPQQQLPHPHPSTQKKRPQQESGKGQQTSQGVRVAGQGVSQEKRVQSRSAVQEKRAQGQPACQHQPVLQQKQPPQLPPHHPSSCSQLSPKPVPRRQQRTHSHQTADRQQHS